ncbi:hypothetical protein SAMN04515674_109150 [Pseudarcicella hirudinis]|uniref:Metallo-peptidase family M12B Reprolysin-like n=1 Tax=Pseudarcicella hirudinis TaxID=1079859 RepID=A0A1I5VJ36_9BACT|nr:hypothetical protein [Pseudarcicella hirudinis]SFQ07479.1 hypothetical protein SAMN04515674_109150 [Pseudarcicella hirudinis]
MKKSITKHFFYLLASTSLFCACQKDSISDLAPKEDITIEEKGISDIQDPSGVIIKTYSFDNDQNSSLMFQDDESEAVMTSEDRAYNIAQVLRVKAIDNKNIEIANFAPFDIKNATIQAQIPGSTNNPIRLLKINIIRAHGKRTIPYPFVKNTTLFVDTEGNKVDLSQYQSTGILPKNISFDFAGDGPIVSRLKKLSKLKWNIKYHDFDPNNDPANNWADDITPKQVRRYTGLMINLGLVAVSNDFKQDFLKEQIIGNDGITPLTLAQKEKTYNDLINFGRLNCGVVGGPNNVIGLGGGSTFGLADYLLKNYINKVGFGDVPAHELGHCLGYNHSSNMTYPQKINGVNTGFSPVMIRAFTRFFEKNEFSVRLDNYYKPSDFN